MTNVQGLVAVVLSGIAFVFAVVGMAIPYWAYASARGNWMSAGLWQRCTHVLGTTKCVSLTYNAMGLELTGIVLIQCSSVCIVGHLHVQERYLSVQIRRNPTLILTKTTNCEI